jgi:hypothetical protein
MFFCSIYGTNIAITKAKQKGIKLIIIALSIWNEQIAPAIDVAEHLLIVKEVTTN